MRNRSLLVAVALALTPVGSAQAGLITYSLEGQVAKTTASSGVSAGAAFTGTLLYDNAPGSPVAGTDYTSFLSGLAALTVTIDGVTYQSNSPAVYMASNNTPHTGFLCSDGVYDSLSLTWNLVPAGPYSNGGVMILTFIDTDALMFADQAATGTVPASLAAVPFKVTFFAILTVPGRL